MILNPGQPARTKGFRVVGSGGHEAAPASRLVKDSAVCAVLYCKNLVTVECARVSGTS